MKILLYFKYLLSAYISKIINSYCYEICIFYIILFNQKTEIDLAAIYMIKHLIFLNKNNYKALKNFFTERLIKHKSDQWKEFISKLPNKYASSKHFWKRINRIRSGQNTGSSIPTLIDPVTGQKLETTEEKVQLFANRLEEIFKESPLNTFDEAHRSKINDWYSNYRKELTNKNNEFPPITLSEMNEVLKSVNNKESVDSTNISNAMLKHLTEKSKIALCNLFNIIIENNCIPASWKTATVTMLFKNKGEASDAKNYRPISVTSVLLRFLEKIMIGRFWEHLKKHKLIINQQSGFRKHRQTKDNLMFLCQKSIEALNRGKKVVGILYDIEGAFDKVWHAGLIYKMVIKFRFPKYLVFFAIDYLSNRAFLIKIDLVTSEVKIIECGVPQGGCLSPLFFLLYINDIPILRQANKAYTNLFADDVADMFITDAIDDNTEDIINERLEDLERWLNLWRLKIAPSKCNYWIISKNRKTGNEEELALDMYNSRIPIDSSGNLKFLGIKFDKYLTFNKHVEDLVARCNNRLNILRVLKSRRWRVNTETLKNVYFTVIRSLLDYSLFLYPILSIKNKNSLQIVQNKALRIILGKTLDDKISSNQLHETLGIEKIAERAHQLKDKYTTENCITGNPLFNEILLDYYNFCHQAKTWPYSTPMDDATLECEQTDEDDDINLAPLIEQNF